MYMYVYMYILYTYIYLYIYTHIYQYSYIDGVLDGDPRWGSRFEIYESILEPHLLEPHLGILEDGWQSRG